MKKRINNILKKKTPHLAQALRVFFRERRNAVPFTRHPDGFKFKGNLAMAHGRFEVAETYLFGFLLDEVDRLINVGANIGYYSCISANRGIPVIAFEPIPENAKLFAENIYENGWENVELLPLALGEKSRILPIHGTGTGASMVEGWAGIPSSDKRFVSVNRLDSLIGNRESLVDERLLFWVDVEGFELEVLKGAGNLLERETGDIWVVEVCVDEHMPNGVKINPNMTLTFNHFWEHGFLACEMSKDMPLVKSEDIALIQSTGVNTLGTHNFIFLKHVQREKLLKLISDKVK